MEPPKLTREEVFKEARASELENTLNEIDDLGPHFEAMDRARIAAVEGILNKMAELAPWRVWELWVYSVFLKAIEVYHNRFRTLMLCRGDYESELEQLRREPSWARISKWRETGDGDGRGSDE